MKSHKFSSLIALGALLPLTAWSQADDMSEKPGAQARDSHTPSGAGAIDKRPGHNSPHYTPDNNERRSEMGGSRSQSRPTQPQTQATDSQQIERVSTEQLDQRLTASSLMGKKVVDSQGQEIGKVKDIGLGSAAPQLAQQQQQRQQQGWSRQGAAARQQPGQTDTTDTSPGLQASRTDGRDRQGDRYLQDQRRQREIDRAGSAGADADMSASGRMAQSGQGQNQQWSRSQQGAISEGEPSIFVQPDRSLGVRGDLVAIPASQIQRQGDQLRLNMSRDELRTLIAQQGERVSMVE